jgi:osmoprotectant transport system permease protein
MGGIASYIGGNWSDILGELWQHILLTVETLAIAMLLALVVGTIVARVRWLYTPVLIVFGVVYTIPSLALLAFLVPFVGTGDEPTLIALVAYAQFILVRNVAVGLREVDPAVVDAARGMGMTGRQILFKIEYPLALPVILGGLRVATVATIAIATIAAWIDAGGLGILLFNGITEDYQAEILTGAIAVSLLAVAADIMLRAVERLLPASKARGT